MKNRLFSILAAVAIMLTVITPSAAAYNQCDYAALSSEELAYCDLDTAPTDWQDDILAARAAIIYSKSWSAAGLVTMVYPDGTTETLPQFSDLFPDWDVPVESVPVVAQPTTYASGPNYYGRYFVPAADDDLAPTFYTFIGNGNSVSVRVTGFSGATYNAGLTNMLNGRSLFWTTRIPTGTTAILRGASSGLSVGVRLSTYSSPGYATVEVR